MNHLDMKNKISEMKNIFDEINSMLDMREKRTVNVKIW